MPAPRIHAFDQRAPCRLAVAGLFALVLLTQGIAQDELPVRPPRVTEQVLRVGPVLNAETLQALMLDGVLLEWPALPAPDAGSAAGRITSYTPRLRVAQVPEGLVMALGNMALDRPFLLKVQIATLAELDVPQISWRWRHRSSITYTTPADCDIQGDDLPRYDATECRRWYVEQVAYRSRLAAQFVRNFEIHADGRVLDPDKLATHYLPLRAGGEVQARTADPPYSMEVLLPWASLPPIDRLVLDRVYLRVELCWLTADSAALRECQQVSTAPATSDPMTDTATFLEVKLPQPREYRLTPCDLPLLSDIRPGLGSLERAYYLPGEQAVVDTVFSLQEPARSYQDKPAGLSPTAHIGFLAWTIMGPNEYVCFPGPRWTRDGQHIDSNTALVEPQGEVAPYHLQPIDDGNFLIVTRPRDNSSVSGQGQCGACLRRSLVFWYLDRKAAELRPALVFNERVENPDDGDRIDFETDPDYRQVRIKQDVCRLEALPGPSDSNTSWINRCTRTTERWCLAVGARTYETCGTEVTEFVQER